jgi:hypothetical protein
VARPAGVLTFTSCLAEIPPFLPILNDADETMPGRQAGDGNSDEPYLVQEAAQGTRAIREVMNGCYTYLPRTLSAQL